ncbi:hypothetical protein LOZ80_23300 [Paenibacillus sp. HWE-109]|uniref:hypothetical protein n=1 Tax=Paenibacillus sp. HWE-109 TaxID=1306526 RepID=UPI001EDFEC0B|nr:hypothetical protein [Paenibacillus sp. HWE-109]UKS24538.1 hypothetical protein LOZ80_23300 [Paenibacillus sp. HWE-109]
MQQLDQKQMLLNVVKSRNDAYNSEFRLLRSPFSSPGYHTTIKQADYIHATRESMRYALALLDTELKEYEQRAFDIIEKIVSLQDTDRSRSTFGIWSWFYEESLDQMSPPDWNWADFIGKQLVLAISRHGDRFPNQLRDTVTQAIYNACDAIIKRDVGPHYTNIAIMGAFVTLIAGERFGRSDYAEYGLNRLAKLHRFTMERGAFQEYNSPPYTYIAILELSKIRNETTGEESKRLSDELLHLAWNSVAEHFHSASKQWSGPHARCYQTLLSVENQAFLQLATNGELMFFPWEELPYEEEWYESGFYCPEPLVALFFSSQEREIRQLYAVNATTQLESWATTYMTKQYSLGSHSREVMWNQKRSLLAYVDNGGQATYLQLRCLHDGYDYCSAVFNGKQDRQHVLFGVEFITNGGDTHPSLDKTGGVIEASDLRLRLEIGGCLDNVSGDSSDNGALISIGKLQMLLRTWYAAFTENNIPQAPLKWEIQENGLTFNVDLILYSGERRSIDFRLIEEAAFLFSFVMDSAEAPQAPMIDHDDNRLIVRTGNKDEETAFILHKRPVEV